MTTPMRQQYLQIKSQYPDTIVLFRLGDFYETFDEDAKTVSQVCDIVLTSRPIGNNTRVPLAGVPHHSVESYIAKLLAAGHKVAIVEQASEPIKGLMDRQVTDVITPGTILEPTLLESRRNNYLAAILLEGERAGIAYTDISTGEFACAQISDRDPLIALARELDRLNPAECLLPDGAAETAVSPWLATLQNRNGGSEARCFSPYESWRFELETARRALLDHLQVQTLEGYGCAHLPLAIRAAGALIQYLKETRKGALAQLTGLSTYSLDQFMVLDASTRRNLELTQTIREGKVEGSLLGVLDRAMTPMGSRLLRRWLNQPLLDLPALAARQDAVQALFDDTLARAALRAALKGLGDLERLANRAAQQIALPRELRGLCAALERVPRLREGLAQIAGRAARLEALLTELCPCESVVTLIAQAIAEDAPNTVGSGNVIIHSFAPELDQLCQATQEARQWIAALEETERQRTGIKNLRVGFNKVFGYYIEVTHGQLARIPADYIRKQTLVNAERFITPELKEKEALILTAQDRLAELETQIYRQVCQQIAAAAEAMLRTARAAAELDVYATLAEVAANNKYARPLLNREDRLEIRAGRHPVIERKLPGGAFVPNDILLTSEEKVLVITGPNMSGKSTILRQTALIVLLAQIGSFVPADSAVIGLTDRIFTRVGAQDDIAAGQSTFMVEMVEVANILNNATARSLLVLDEVGRGTSTYDGISIAWAVVEYIHNHPRLQAKTLFATHYHELCELAKLLPRVRNYNVAVVEEGDRVVFLHKLIPGGADRSYGIHVARLAGLPRAVLSRAEEILDKLEAESAHSPGDRPAPPSRRVIKVQQLSLLPASHPLLEELAKLDVLAMSPLEAINKLYELQQRAKSADSPKKT